MLSYHADADITTNPFEVGLDRLVAIESDINFIGKKALQKIYQEGIKRTQVGLEISGEAFQGPNTIFWPVQRDGKTIRRQVGSGSRSNQACPADDRPHRQET